MLKTVKFEWTDYKERDRKLNDLTKNGDKYICTIELIKKDISTETITISTSDNVEYDKSVNKLFDHIFNQPKEKKTKEIDSTQLIWRCKACNDVLVSYSHLRHVMNTCECGLSSVDLEQEYMRLMGEIEIISKKVRKNGKWVIEEKEKKETKINYIKNETPPLLEVKKGDQWKRLETK